MAKDKEEMYQVSTLTALSLGYTKPVIRVRDLLRHGDTGLGTFEDVNGEMIVVDGHCYQALSDGTVKEADPGLGVPFSSVTKLSGERMFALSDIESIDKLKEVLTVKIEENFGLNSMNVVRIDGSFGKIDARSETPFESQHISLKDILDITQESFSLGACEGTIICVYYPDYMDGINAPGWHVHFISADHTKGGHVFELNIEHGEAMLDKISKIEIEFPSTPSFDTYTLTEASQGEIKQVEQGKK